MMSFDAYRWEDHVPRHGSWKFNLGVATLAVGLIATALPDDRGEASSFADRAAEPERDIRLSMYATLPELHPLLVASRTGSERCAPAPQRFAYSSSADYGTYDPTKVARR